MYASRRRTRTATAERIAVIAVWLVLTWLLYSGTVQLQVCDHFEEAAVIAFAIIVFMIRITGDLLDVLGL